MMKAVIFDMDGVIIDSEPFHLEVNRKIFRQLGISVTTEEYDTYIGVSNTNMWTAIKSRHGLVQPVKELVDMQVTGNIGYMKKERIYPVVGVVDFIKELDSMNIKIALASSSPYSVIDIVLDTFGIKKFFNAIVSGEDFIKGKPAPDIFLKAAKLLSIKPEDCVVIEDSSCGVSAAKAAGMTCYALRNPNSGNQDLSPADMVFGRFVDIDVQHIVEGSVAST
jgi:HAD superfamily hydrolase (TIGR01509 family)